MYINAKTSAMNHKLARVDESGSIGGHRRVVAAIWIGNQVSWQRVVASNPNHTVAGTIHIIASRNVKRRVGVLGVVKTSCFNQGDARWVVVVGAKFKFQRTSINSKCTAIDSGTIIIHRNHETYRMCRIEDELHGNPDPIDDNPFEIIIFRIGVTIDIEFVACTVVIWGF